jgi:hypothetical protein
MSAENGMLCFDFVNERGSLLRGSADATKSRMPSPEERIESMSWTLYRAPRLIGVIWNAHEAHFYALSPNPGEVRERTIEEIREMFPEAPDSWFMTMLANLGQEQLTQGG